MGLVYALGMQRFMFVRSWMLQSCYCGAKLVKVDIHKSAKESGVLLWPQLSVMLQHFSDAHNYTHNSTRHTVMQSIQLTL